MIKDNPGDDRRPRMAAWTPHRHSFRHSRGVMEQRKEPPSVRTAGRARPLGAETALRGPVTTPGANEATPCARIAPARWGGTTLTGLRLQSPALLWPQPITTQGNHDHNSITDMTGSREVRTVRTRLTARDDGGPAFRVSGYASLVSTPYDVGSYDEQISPGAFAGTLSCRPDIQLLVNHEGLAAGHDRTAGTARAPVPH